MSRFGKKLLNVIHILSPILALTLLTTESHSGTTMGGFSGYKNNLKSGREIVVIKGLTIMAMFVENALEYSALDDALLDDVMTLDEEEDEEEEDDLESMMDDEDDETDDMGDGDDDE